MSEAKQMQEDLGMNKTIVLKYPVRLNTGDTLQTLTMRRPRVGDLRAVAHLKTDAEQELALLARITGLVPEDLDLLDLADYKVLQETFRSTQEDTAA